MIVNNKTVTKEEIEIRLLNRRLIKEGHWLWTGALNQDGYGSINVNKKTIEVHRLSAWIYLNLNIEDSKKHALHKQICIIRRCFNPEHLYIGNHYDNMTDRVESGRSTINTRKSNPNFCPKGHARTKNNTVMYINARGNRVRRCRDCRRLTGK